MNSSARYDVALTAYRSEDLFKGTKVKEEEWKRTDKRKSGMPENIRA
jgi:hypothetical protein